MERAGGGTSGQGFSGRAPVHTGCYLNLLEDGGGRAGLPAKVSLHSLWIGGAIAAMMAGLTREQIMMIGGWSSAAVDRYLWVLEMTKLGVLARMGL